MDEHRTEDVARSALVNMFQSVSIDPDPVSSTRLFLQTIREYYGNMGLVTIGTRNAPRKVKKLSLTPDAQSI